jgi:hypothetical protein
MQRPRETQRSRTKTISRSSSALISTLLLLVAATARADDGAVEKLPAGTAIEKPGAAIVVTTETTWLLTRPAVEKAIVTAADLRACQEAVKACENRAAGADPKPSFWSSPTGHIIIGAGAIGLFGSGAVLGARLR